MKIQAPKISGFTLIRNGTRFDYPYLESIQSLLPWVDELIINVGKGEDDTLEKIRILSKSEDKIKFFESDWQLSDPQKKKGGQILSEQTNLALDRCSYDWCLYLQADEILHEADAENFKKAIQNADPRTEVEGLLFDYLHFYGSFNVIQNTRSAYRREVRAIRKSAGAQSIGDAQSFRKKNGEKLSVLSSKSRVFHYGWVRTPEAMKEKTFFLDQLYHGEPEPEKAKLGIPHTGDNYRYKRFWGLKPFMGQHPLLMKKRIQTQGWNWDLENSPFTFKLVDFKKVVLDSIESITGYRFFEYKNYKLLKR